MTAPTSPPNKPIICLEGPTAAGSADRVIAQFMNCRIWFDPQNYLDETSRAIFCNETEERVSDLYSKSLDALVPVWQELDDNMIIPFAITLMGDYLGKPTFEFNEKNFLDEYIPDQTGETVQQAAAIATAKAILAMRRDGDGQEKEEI